MMTLVLAARERCMSSRKPLTEGMAETSDARREISGVRISPETPSPLSHSVCTPPPSRPSVMSSLGSSALTDASSPASKPQRSTARPTVR